MSTYPQVLYVGSNVVDRYTSESMEDINDDPRGLLLLYEPIRDDVKYIMAFDPSEGITGWTRHSRVDGDHKTDNCAIEILRPNARYTEVLKDGIPAIDPVTKRPIYKGIDRQVAEWVGPCDAVEGARLCSTLGRLFHGSDEDQCQLIWEAWPGVGLLATQELLRLGYSNLWMWQYIDREVVDTDSPGWRSSSKSQRLLWYRARRHLMNEQVDIYSRFLLDELSNAEIDIEKMRARAAYGYHDDRFMALNMGLWASHSWTYDEDAPPEVIRVSPIIDFQTYAPGLDDYRTFKEHIDDAITSMLEED